MVLCVCSLSAPVILTVPSQMPRFACLTSAGAFALAPLAPCSIALLQLDAGRGAHHRWAGGVRSSSVRALFARVNAAAGVQRAGNHRRRAEHVQCAARPRFLRRCALRLRVPRLLRGPSRTPRCEPGRRSVRLQLDLVCVRTRATGCRPHSYARTAATLFTSVGPGSERCRCSSTCHRSTPWP